MSNEPDLALPLKGAQSMREGDDATRYSIIRTPIRRMIHKVGPSVHSSSLHLALGNFSDGVMTFR